MSRPPDIAYTGLIPVCWSRKVLHRGIGDRRDAPCHIQGLGLRNDKPNWKRNVTLCGIEIDDPWWDYEAYDPEDHSSITCKRCRAVWHRIHREEAEGDFNNS